jgi:hypothetical protein
MSRRRVAFVARVVWLISMFVAAATSRPEADYSERLALGPIHLTRGELMSLLGWSAIVLGVVAFVLTERALRQRGDAAAARNPRA